MKLKGKINIKNKTLILLFAVIGLLLLLNLGNMYLWTDEASTALLGKNILNYGYPRAFDGKNWVTASISPEIGLSLENQINNPQQAYTIHSWLQYYTAALSLKLFGYSTFGVRLLFVLISFASLFLIYRLFNKLYPEKKTVLLAMLILISTTFFFTYSRQVRYYPLLLFFTAGLLLSYINLLKRNKSVDATYFSVCGIMLFHSNYLAFFITFLALAIHFMFFTKYKEKIKKMAVSCLFIAVFTLPWFIYAAPWRFIGAGNSFLLNVYVSFSFLIESLNYHMPLLILILLPLLLTKKAKGRIKKIKGRSKRKRIKNDYEFSDKFLFVFILVPLIILILFSNAKRFRYLIGFSPLFFVFCSRIYFLIRKNFGVFVKVIALVVLVLLMTTNILSLLPLFVLNNSVVVNTLSDACLKFAPEEKQERCERFVRGTLETDEIKFPIFYYLYEITHDYDCPNEGESIYLNEHGTEDDLVYAYYGFLPLQFYTDMKVLDPSRYDLNNITIADEPDWIIPRWKGDYATNELEQYAVENNYEKIELKYPDIYWGNMPDMGNHRFWTLTDVPDAVIYKKQ